MNKANVVIAIVIVAILAAFGGYLAGKSTPTGGAASITAYNALNSAALQNELQLIANPLTGWLASSTTLNATALGPVGASTSTASTSITLTGVSVGDYLEWSVSTTTVNVSWNCSVTAANTAVCYETNLQSPAQTPATTTVNILDLPKSTFVSPSGL